MRLTSLLVLPASLLAGSFFACGGRVEVDPAGAPGPTGTTSPTGSPTGTPTSSPTGTGTTTPTTSPTGTATGYPPICEHTNDRLDISVEGSISASCALRGPGGGPSPTTHFEGELIKAGTGFITVDTCPPTADCAESIVTLYVKGAGLDLSTLPIGSLVDVTATFQWSWGCNATVLVKSLDEWGGMKNPVDVGGHTYLVGAEGVTTVAGAPFAVSRVDAGCAKSPYPSCGSEKPADYQLVFLGSGAGGSSANVPMGGNGKFSSEAQTFTARNLRSYYDGACDAYWNYAFWAKGDIYRR
jgi:hypothetical protein